MEIEIIFVYVLLAFTAVSAASIEKRGKGKCDSSILDNNGLQILKLTNRNFTYPTNSQEMQATCEIWEKSTENIRAYASECLDSLHRQVLRLLLYGAEKTNQESCTENGRKEGLRFYPCISKHKQRLWMCGNKLITDLQAIVDVHMGADRIVSTCCTFTDFATCFYKAMLELCDEDTANYLKSLEDGFISDLWDLACVGYDITEEKCLASKVNSTDGNIIENRLSALLPLMTQLFLNV